MLSHHHKGLQVLSVIKNLVIKLRLMKNNTLIPHTIHCHLRYTSVYWFLSNTFSQKGSTDGISYRHSGPQQTLREF